MKAAKISVSHKVLPRALPNNLRHALHMAISIACIVAVILVTAMFISGVQGMRHSSSIAQASLPASSEQDQPHTALRIGTYDSRAVAVAYVRSATFQKTMRDLKQQRDEAVKAKDQKRIDQLDAKGSAMQIRINLQGFSTAPIDDVMDTVRDRLPAIAQHQNIAAILRYADYRDPSVDVVDITDDLVKLFQPDEATLKVVAELRKQSAQPIEDVAKIPAKN
jgi:hypothetical protein